MATRQNINLEWLNHNSQRRYPLAADASCQDVSGTFQLPNDFIVGLYLPVAATLVVDPASFFIKTIAAFGAGYTVTVGYKTPDDQLIPVAAASVPKVGHAQYDSYPLRGFNNFYDSLGRLVVGSFDGLDDQPAGQWEFDLTGGRLEVDAIRPQLRGVSQLRIQNGGDLSAPIVGDVVLRAGRNIRLTQGSEGGDAVIQIDAIEGEGLTEACVCEGDAAEAPPIRSINGIKAAANGNFTLLGSSCLETVTLDNALQLKDTCSEPCCGCKELEAVTAALENFGRSATTLENFIVSLEARVTQMDQVVLGSRLGDRGCAECPPPAP